MKKWYCLLFVITGMASSVYAEFRVMFFVRTFPELNKTVNADTVLKTFADPRQAIQHILQSNQPTFPLSGLFATYAGYVTSSTIFDGLMFFPRKQQRPSFSLVITPEIKPIIMLGRTVHHWELIKGMSAAMYTVERKQDPDTHLYFWQVSEAKRPKNNIIPLSAIVLFAKPKHIYVPLGITLTNDNPELLLPDIYVKKGFNLVNNALSVLKVKHFFEAVRLNYKKATERTWQAQMAE